MREQFPIVKIKNKPKPVICSRVFLTFFHGLENPRPFLCTSTFEIMNYIFPIVLRFHCFIVEKVVEAILDHISVKVLLSVPSTPKNFDKTSSFN